MFEALSGRLSTAFQSLSSKGKLTEKDVDAALRDVRMALLEADVDFRVVRDLVARIRSGAVEEKVLSSLSPGQQVVKIANKELTAVLGGAARRVMTGVSSPSVMLLAGLNGSGKTTTAVKIAKHLKQLGQSSILIAADLMRPAAREQLEVLGGQAGVEVYKDDLSNSAESVVRGGVKYAVDLGVSWVIVDTAGRFQVDEKLMNELNEIKKISSPIETLLVVDAMIGQEGVEVAKEFHNKIGITGLVMTKLDSDARGGAALSIVDVTGIPIKFIGVGERLDDLEQFYPDRLASRILGMGDVLTLIERSQAAFGRDQAAELEKKMKGASFNLEDFLTQLNQLKRMGPLNQVIDMIPGISSVKARMSGDGLGQDQIKKVEAIIFSMTPQERRYPDIIKGSRRRRIARGSGTNPQAVNQVLNQFRQMQKLMQQFASGEGLDLSRLFR